jgi:cellulose synthase/poly-beta-1,6-N-acetylglucosamine synthase-like glycosyltransferase
MIGVWIFIICCCLIIYPYIGYPLVLAAMTRFRRLLVRDGEGTPTMTFIISAYNEKDVIAGKIRNTLALDYPSEKRQIIVVSDCSDDGTDDIVRSFSWAGVELLALPERRGKTFGLNEAVQKAKGDILVFSDADSLYDPDALLLMARWFSGEAAVGLVTGSTRYGIVGEGRMVETTGLYTRLERFIKREESKLGSCVGADGAIFAMRKELFQPLKEDDINDLILPLHVVRQGKRVIFHGELYCSEAPAADEQGEFNRQTRITARTLRALSRNTDLMNFLKYPLFAFSLFSHKALRLSAPLWMVILILLSIILAPQYAFFTALMACQFICYGVSIMWFLKKKGKMPGRLTGFAYHFIIMHLAMLIGWLVFLLGKKIVVWNPQKQ